MEENQAFIKMLRGMLHLYDMLLKQECMQYGLSNMELNVVALIAHVPQCTTARDIVQRSLLTKSNVSQAVERLQQLGYVQRVRDSQDRRVYRLRLTEKAQPVAEKTGAVRRLFMQTVFHDFTKQERVFFLEQCARIEKNAANAVERGVSQT